MSSKKPAKKNREVESYAGDGIDAPRRVPRNGAGRSVDSTAVVAVVALMVLPLIITLMLVSSERLSAGDLLAVLAWLGKVTVLALLVLLGGKLAGYVRKNILGKGEDEDE